MAHFHKIMKGRTLLKKIIKQRQQEDHCPLSEENYVKMSDSIQNLTKHSLSWDCHLT